MCIYYKGIDNLHYDSREHIFPAAIGGNKRLPSDYVSREFNTAISKLELEFVRESFVSMAREIEGPGKKGRLGERYATKSKVHVVTNGGDEKMFALGYIKTGRTSEIPHFSLDTKTGEIAISFNYEEGKDGIEISNEFIEKCKEVENLKMRTILNDKLPATLILFGIQTDIENNYQCFFAKHPSNILDFGADIIKRVGNGINMNGQNPGHIKYMPQSQRTAKFSIEYFRIYAKWRLIS